MNEFNDVSSSILSDIIRLKEKWFSEACPDWKTKLENRECTNCSVGLFCNVLDVYSSNASDELESRLTNG